MQNNQTLRLEAKDLWKSYKRAIVCGVSLEVNQGEVVGLLGPNGAGKTTSFYMMIGLVTPDKGQVLLDGQDICHLPVYRRAQKGIGYLPQEPSIFRGLSVENNLRAILQFHIKSREEQNEIIDQLLAEFAIEHIRHSPAIALSGGERRRVEIARTIATQPRFVLLDEPFSGIDPIAVNEIRELIQHLKSRNIGVLITDHNVRETLDIVDHAYILNEGKVLMKGTPTQIVENEMVRRVYLGDRFKM